MRVIEADLTYVNGAFLPGIGVECDDLTGRITRVLPISDLREGQRLRLRDRALMPGFVNVHSHTFQRVIRGRTQWRPLRNTADFWS